MIEVILVGEGQAEESFARDILAPLFWDRRIFIRPRLIRTSAMGRGGALSWPRVKRYLRNSLRERRDTFVTTFFDLYGLDAEFPGQAEATGIRDPLRKAEVIEARFAAAIVDEAGCRADRFLPHVQPYEFESLLFSGVEVLPEVYSEWQAFLEPPARASRSRKSRAHQRRCRHASRDPLAEALAAALREGAARPRHHEEDRDGAYQGRVPAFCHLAEPDRVVGATRVQVIGR